MKHHALKHPGHARHLPHLAKVAKAEKKGIVATPMTKIASEHSKGGRHGK